MVDLSRLDLLVRSNHPGANANGNDGWSTMDGPRRSPNDPTGVIPRLFAPDPVVGT